MTATLLYLSIPTKKLLLFYYIQYNTFALEIFDSVFNSYEYIL